MQNKKIGPEFRPLRGMGGSISETFVSIAQGYCLEFLFIICPLIKYLIHDLKFFCIYFFYPMATNCNPPLNAENNR